jgi:hypothetical protein
MRARLPLLLGLVVSSAQAEEPEAVASPRGTVALDSAMTRYGTSYETVYQLNVQPSAALHLGAFELSATLPFGTSATAPTYCCRTTLGNATVAAVHSGHDTPLRHRVEASVSAPTSYWSDAHASSLAATAALMQDPGYYLPNTTTLRVSLGGEVNVSGRLWLGASAGAHYWVRHGQATNALILPLDATARLPLGQGWSARLVFRTLARVHDAAARERFLSELSAAVAHEWSASRIEMSVFVPLDESLRQLEMLGLGAAYSRSF